MKILFDERQLLHAPESYFRQGRIIAHPEQPARAILLRDALLADGHQLTQPRDHGASPIKAVHDPAYVDFFDTAWQRWQAYGEPGTIGVPNYHISHGRNRCPTGIVGQLGYYSTDTACPVSEGTREAIYWSAQCAIDGAERLIGGEDLIYALCQPPGHHASRGNSNGFCYFNNAAIAAHHLRQKFQRVAIVDIDTHAGQGTQDIFYERADVLFASIHVDPSDYPPFFACYADERGAGAGLGASLNVVLDKGTGEAAILAGIDQLITATRDFAADAVVVSLGFDMATDDPLSELVFSGDGFAAAASRIMALDLPTLLVQEGGYLGPSLSSNAVRFLRAAEDAVR
ncbi:MAG: histone deacetylase family protein [Rhodospirillales bacterium]|nr:histone deacetylase family protein [Rhodospirillales bacterium]